ncbi:MAG: tyrosine-type recombinase/integrase [Thermoleophilia bacterium]
MGTIRRTRTESSMRADDQWNVARLVCVLDRHLEARSSRMAGAAMMKLVLYTGMRRGEIFRLKWSDLGFHRNNILLREPKGGRDVVIPMSSHTRLLLESLSRAGPDSPESSESGDQESNGLESLKGSGSDRGSDYVFPGRGGGQGRDVREQVTNATEGGFPSERE